MKWAIAGKPPRTEYTGETHYAEIISMAVHGAVSRDDLLPILRINVEIPIINQRAQIERQTTERRNQ